MPASPPQRLEALDFRLLRVFSTVMQERSLTRAATRLGISQPAVSQSLGRLRTALDDTLFLRSGARLIPTARAERIAGPVAEILATWERGLRASDDFDPATAEREFACMITDLGAILMLPRLLAHLRAVAPGIRLRAMALESGDIAAGLESGRVDLAIGPFPRMPDGVYQQRLFDDDYVCLVRARHPLLRRPLDAETYRHAEHLVVSTAGSAHAFSPLVEATIAALVPANRIRLRAHSFSAAAFLIRDSDMLLTLPRRSGHVVAAPLGLKVLEVPLPLRRLEIHQYWHERQHRDPGHAWLRAQVAALFGERRERAASQATEPRRRMV
jgi:DNA-binding transcriptional LysR family regulator